MDLKFQVEKLQLAITDPRLFIIDYFSDFINKLDLNTIKFEDNNEDIHRVQNWRDAKIIELQTAQTEFLARITKDFEINTNLKHQVYDILDRFNEHVDEDQFEDEVYECLLELQRQVFGNQCFILLNSDMLSKLECNDMDSFDLWEQILPIAHVKEGVISNKGLQLIQ